MSNATPADATNPDHYKRLDPEPIEVIEKWDLSFHLGNAVKYIARAGHKISTSAALDLAKAAWYLNRARGEHLVESDLRPQAALHNEIEVVRRAAMQWRVTAERLAVRIRDHLSDPKAIARTAWSAALHGHYECDFERWWTTRAHVEDRDKSSLADVDRVLAGCPLVEEPVEPTDF